MNWNYGDGEEKREDLLFYVADFSKALFGALQIGQVQSSGN
jgi:hypothetical protein